MSTGKTLLPSIFFIESFLGRKTLLYRPHPIPSFRSRDPVSLPVKRSVQSPIRFQRKRGGFPVFSLSAVFLLPLSDPAPNPVFRVQKTFSAGPCSFSMSRYWTVCLPKLFFMCDLVRFGAIWRQSRFLLATWLVFRAPLVSCEAALCEQPGSSGGYFTLAPKRPTQCKAGRGSRRAGVAFHNWLGGSLALPTREIFWLARLAWYFCGWGAVREAGAWKPRLAARRDTGAACGPQARPGPNRSGPGRVAASIPPPFPAAGHRSAPPRGLQHVNEQIPACPTEYYITRFRVFASFFHLTPLGCAHPTF